jgi:DNA processing protein
MLEWAEGELTRIREQGFRFLGYPDPDYPAPLREIPDPPLGLYLNGSTPPTQIFEMHPMVGVVGTRDLSPYGRAWCRKLVEGLARAKVQPCIVSGMALGADGIAHQTALECSLTTIGVLPTGIDKMYPWQHERLAMQMVGMPGCGLVTDYPTGTAPVALNFLRRNRIIAALTRAVIVVESKSKGGSLMTARYAGEYGRDVYALPGRADDLRSAGCNSLIHENMAEIITTPEDLDLARAILERRRACESDTATTSTASSKASR